MALDPHLVDTIKWHFARKSSAQLEAIVQANDPELWSPEAVAAAGELLRERATGNASEPAVPEPERPAPAEPPDPYSLAFLALGALGGLGGVAIIPIFREVRYEDQDLDFPIPFGPKMAWLALDTTDTEAAAVALGLQASRKAPWVEGIEGAHRSSVFVPPPLADWTLAVGTPLFPPDRVEAFVRPLLERLSRQFGEAQYFCTHQDHDLHIWARARQGRLIRGYGWFGKKGLTLWNEGRPTPEERDLGFGSVGQDATPPTVQGVMQLASLWSIDPSGLDEQYKEPATGLLGELGPDGRGTN